MEITENIFDTRNHPPGLFLILVFTIDSIDTMAVLISEVDVTRETQRIVLSLW